MKRLLICINLVLLLASSVLIMLQRDPEGAPLLNGYHGLQIILVLLGLAAIANALTLAGDNEA